MLTVVKGQRWQIQQLPMFLLAAVENQLVEKLILDLVCPCIPGCFKHSGTTGTSQLASFAIDMAVWVRMAPVGSARLVILGAL